MSPLPRLSPATAMVPLRLIVGFGFLAHGWAKWQRGPAGFAKLLDQIGTPMPTQTAWAVTLLGVFGGLAVMAGALVTVVSVPLIGSMLVAMFSVHVRYGFSSVNTVGLTPAGPVFGPPGYELNLLYVAALVALALAGPTAASVDGWLLRRRLSTTAASAAPTRVATMAMASTTGEAVHRAPAADDSSSAK